MTLCPEENLRQSLPDGDFWEYVFNRRLPGDPDPTEVDWDGQGAYCDPDDEPDIDGPCEVCGSTGACGYDEVGRAMIHATPRDNEVT